ncbi:hypothetical protein ACH4ZX_15600 [Streptomyces sp. NPDC020490]|uniref:hypothetical protein n=1 Tax=Streptomyces sp. NPDC020490 TaxID=3365078 RepID=UPI0037B5F9F7
MAVRTIDRTPAPPAGVTGDQADLTWTASVEALFGWVGGLTGCSHSRDRPASNEALDRVPGGLRGMGKRPESQPGS